jgi:hypothetical protein
MRLDIARASASASACTSVHRIERFIEHVKQVARLQWLRNPRQTMNRMRFTAVIPANVDPYRVNEDPKTFN